MEITNQTLSLISQRRSHRAYEPKPLTEGQKDALLKAAVQSPSAMNRQPWHFTLVEDQKLLDEVNRAAREVSMQKDAASRSPRFDEDTFHIFYHAPAVVFISGDPDSYWTKIDCGIAVQNMAIAAESMGLGSVILGLPRAAFQHEKAEELREKLHFPAGTDFVIALAVGTPADDKEAHPVKEGAVTRL